jgi:hypothetical protein
MWDCTDSQEVGLEAAILERVRNSSLVEWSCADNETGLKPRAEAADFFALRRSGRGASSVQRSGRKSGRGARSRANAGMSSERRVRNSSAECPRVPGEG